MIGKGPQPVGLAGHPPRGLVGVQHGGFQGFRLDLFVPGKKSILKASPKVHQPAAGQLHLQMIVEDVDDLRNRVAQGVVHPTGHHRRAVAQGSPRQGVGNLRLDQLLAPRAPVATDRMFRHNGRDAFGNVLNEAWARARAAFQPPLAIRTARQPMFAFSVDPRRWSAVMAFVPWPAARTS